MHAAWTSGVGTGAGAAALDEMITMLPPPCARIPGMTACAMLHPPHTLVRTARRKHSYVSSANGVTHPGPHSRGAAALCTRMSGDRSNASTTRSMTSDLSDDG